MGRGETFFKSFPRLPREYTRRGGLTGREEEVSVTEEERLLEAKIRFHAEKINAVRLRQERVLCRLAVDMIKLFQQYQMVTGKNVDEQIKPYREFVDGVIKRHAAEAGKRSAPPGEMLH